MDEKKNEKKEENAKKMKEMDTSEVMDFDDLRNEKADQKIDSDKKEEADKADTEKQNSEKNDTEEKEKKNSAKEKESGEKNTEKSDSNKKEQPVKKKADSKKKGTGKAVKNSEPEKASEKKDTEKKEEADVKEEDFTKKESEKKNSNEKESGEKNTEKSDSDKKEQPAQKEPDSDKKETEKAVKASNKEKDSEKKDTAKKEEAGAKDTDSTKKETEKEAKASDKTKESGPKEELHNNTIKKDKTGKKGLFIALGSIAAVLLLVYVAGFFYFSGHFYKDVSINGVNVSGMNQDNARQILDSFYSNYKLTLTLIDGTEELIDGKDISMAITLRDDFQACFKEQKPYLWFLNMFEHYDFSVGADTTWDAEALNDIYASMDIIKTGNMKTPEDAYVGVVDGKFDIVEEVLGTTIVVDDFKKTVEDGLSSVTAMVDLVAAGCYRLPAVYADDEGLKAEFDAKNEYGQNEIKLQMDDLILEPGMELYEEVLEKKGDSYEVSENKVRKYVENLAKEYDSLGTDRTFTTSWNDRKIKTHGDAFGYVLNKDETTKKLSNALKEKKPATIEAVFESKGYSLQGENDIGDTYIEVNLSEQHVYAYKNGKKLADADCVSGKESIGHGTCIGLYAIQDKLSPTVLRGEKKPVTKTVTKKNKKGKKVKVEETSYEYEYESPVTYWMQFNGGIGLHDAAGWRSVYGGSIYYYSGSHGCVNLPLDFAKTLYENFDIGTPVIVYFWDNENRK